MQNINQKACGINSAGRFCEIINLQGCVDKSKPLGPSDDVLYLEALRALDEGTGESDAAENKAFAPETISAIGHGVDGYEPYAPRGPPRVDALVEDCGVRL